MNASPDHTHVHSRELEPLLQLLSISGVAPAAGLIRDIQRPLTLASAVEVMQSAGLPGRVVRAGAPRLGEVLLPTLIAIDGDHVALLLRIGTDDADLVLMTGPLTISRSECTRRFAGRLVDRDGVDVMRGGLFRGIAKLLASHRALLYQFAATTAAAAVLGVGTPILTRAAIDRALPHGATDMLTAIVLGVALVGLHVAWFGLLSQRAVIALNIRLERALAQGVFDRMLKVHLSDALQGSTGERLETLLSAEWLIAGLSYAIASLLIDGALVFSSLVFLLSESPSVCCLVGGVTLLMSFGAFLLGHQLARTEAIEARALAKQDDCMMELVQGVESIRVAAAEQWMIAAWRRAFVAWLVGRLSKQRTILSLATALALIEGVAIAVLILWLGRASFAGGASTGELITALQSGVLVISAGPRFGSRVATFWIAGPHLSRVRSALALEQESHMPHQSAEDLGEEAIVLDDVWFRYDPSAAWVLRGYSMRVSRGALHELTSASGSGKTTILRLIAGLYRPQRGTVRIGGVDAHVARDWVTYSPQTATLFAGTIIDNLRWLSGGASMDRIEAAAALTGLDTVIADWPAKYQTQIADRGEGISGGQRQLVVLTAVIAGRRPVLLLDEAMSSMDRISRGRLASSQLFSGRTVVSAVHDPHVRE